jgi:hypothetical protein
MHAKPDEQSALEVRRLCPGVVPPFPGGVLGGAADATCLLSGKVSTVRAAADTIITAAIAAITNIVEISDFN